MESLEQFARRLEGKVHPGDLAQREKKKDGTPDVWVLNKYHEGDNQYKDNYKGQYARMKELKRKTSSR